MGKSRPAGLIAGRGSTAVGPMRPVGVAQGSFACLLYTSYLYLFTCPHRNMIGLYYIPLAYCSADLGMEPERVSEGFRELQDAGLLLCDEAEEMVLLPEFLRMNPLDNANVEKKACTVFSALPETWLFGPFGAILEQLPKPFPHLLERVSERYGNTEDRKQKTETEDRIPKAEAEGRRCV